MKAKEHFRRMGESRGATGRIVRGAKGMQDWWPEWVREAYRMGWMQGRIAWIDRNARKA